MSNIEVLSEFLLSVFVWSKIDALPSLASDALESVGGQSTSRASKCLIECDFDAL